MSGWLSTRNLAVIVLLAALVLLPVYVEFTGNRFLLTLFTRIIILALAAVSLNMILGYGGMMSFGHAVYLGIGVRPDRTLKMKPQNLLVNLPLARRS